MKDDRLIEMRVFKAVVEAGGFTAAAHLLGVSQPFASRTVTSLEERLGVALLHRSTRGSRLTDEGRKFLAACSKIFDEIDQAEAEAAAAHSQVTGDLRVTAPMAFGLDQVGPLVPGFLAANPKVTLTLSLSDTIASLIEDDIDVAIRMGRLQDSSLVSRRLCSLQRIVVATPGYLDVAGIPRTPHDLADHNCLLWHGQLAHLNRWPFVIDGNRQDLSVRGSFRSGNGPTLGQMCFAGVGVLRMAEHMALPAIRKGLLVPLLQEYQAEDDTAIHAVYLPERQLLPRIRSFVDYLAEVFHVPPWGERGGLS